MKIVDIILFIIVGLITIALSIYFLKDPIYSLLMKIYDEEKENINNYEKR